MISRHVQLLLVVAPCVARAVRVHLDAKAIRIGEIDRFAHEVIRHAGVFTDRREMRDEPAERCAIGQQDREVIEAEQSALRHRSRAPELAQVNDLAIFAIRSETHRLSGAADHSHSEHLLVEGERSLEIRDLQTHFAEAR
jgi:hypothetical protein